MVFQAVCFLKFIFFSECSYPSLCYYSPDDPHHLLVKVHLKNSIELLQWLIRKENKSFKLFCCNRQWKALNKLYQENSDLDVRWIKTYIFEILTDLLCLMKLKLTTLIINVADFMLFFIYLYIHYFLTSSV